MAEAMITLVMLIASDILFYAGILAMLAAVVCPLLGIQPPITGIQALALFAGGVVMKPCTGWLADRTIERDVG